MHLHPAHAIHPCLRGALGTLSALLLALPAAATVTAPQSPFIASGVGVWTAVGTPIIAEQFPSATSGQVVAEVGAAPIAYGKFRSTFGSVGFQAQTTGGLDREVDGGTLWSDGVTITGGSGTGTVSLGTHIAGTVSGRGEMFYGLFVSDSPFDMATVMSTVGAADGFWQVQLPGASRVLYTGIANGCGQAHPMGDCGHVPFENFQGSFAVTLGANVTFTYGQPFYVLAAFGGGMGVEGGNEDFYNSANFTLDAPAGALVASLSGTQYIAAVPEPAAAYLLLAGLGLLGAVARRRRA